MNRRWRLLVALIIVGACSSDIPPANPDAEVIEALREAGSNLSKPHPIEFFFYFAEKSAAESACDTLRTRGFSAAVEPSASTADFVCLATKAMTPRVEEMNRLSTDFEELAHELGGEYDGWGTPVVE